MGLDINRQWLFIATNLFCFLVLIFPRDVLADDQKSLRDDLRRIYVHKTLSFRKSYFGRNLQFDSSGNVIGNAVPGPWSTCGLLEVQKLELSSNRLEIDGKRTILVLRSTEAPSQHPSLLSKAKATILATNEQLRVSIDMTTIDVKQVNQVLAQVFQGGRLDERVAAYWKPQAVDTQASTSNPIVGELEGNRPVYSANRGVEHFVDPPKPVHTPDPVYTDVARRDRVEGTAVLMAVINEKGIPEVVEIVRSLGDGLDTEALAAVTGWRFRPAMKKGEPVAVAITVEVRFRLY
jgi:TonB family protein